MLAQRLDQVHDVWLPGLPQAVFWAIIDRLTPREQARLAGVNGFMNNALGGTKGARLRKEQHEEQNPPMSWEEWEARNRRKMKEINREEKAHYKLRISAAIVELMLRRGQPGVGYRSISRKFNVPQPALRRLETRLFEEGFFQDPDWQHNVLESGLLTGSDSSGEE